MSIAFVLISIIPGKEHEVYNKISQLKYITEVHPLLGQYDMIAKLDIGDISEVGKLVINDIRSISGVLDTKTLTEIRL